MGVEVFRVKLICQSLIAPSAGAKLVELLKSVGETGTVGISYGISDLLKTVVCITQ